VAAGNKAAVDEVETILKKAGKEVRVTENVMPRLEELNIEPARQAIRQVFLDQIIQAKGIAQAEEYIDKVIMPTPSAVMKAAELIANGTEEEPGLGDLMIVDIGGATTDVHSAAWGEPTKSNVQVKGLEEPYLKRTVEGDLGMRYSASALLETVGKQELLTYCPEGVEEQEIITYINKVEQNIDYVPENKKEEKLDCGLARAAVKRAVKRHVGRIKTVYTPFGESFIQQGKDLTELDLLIGTGGVLVHNQFSAKILQAGLFTEAEPTVLAPKEPTLKLDKEYILASVGLLAEEAPTEALKVAKKYLETIGGNNNGSKK
jgi:uncharacterized protein (TIGR01319 family)